MELLDPRTRERGTLGTAVRDPFLAEVGEKKSDFFCLRTPQTKPAGMLQGLILCVLAQN